MTENSTKEGELIHHELIHSLNHNPLRRLPATSYWYENFDLGFDVFKEAAACYDCGNYVASAVMCRNALDSFLYLATRMRNIRDWHDVATEAGVDERIYDTFYERDPKIEGIINSDGELKYHVIKEIVERRGILSEEDFKDIKVQIRNKGSFSAHLIEAKDRASSKWWKEHGQEFMEMIKEGAIQKDPEVFDKFAPKGWTRKEDVLALIKRTRDAIEKIVVNYYKSEDTIKEIYRGR